MSTDRISVNGSDLGGSAVLMYDGDCSFCQRCASFVRRRLASPVDVCAAASCDLGALKISETDAAESVRWVDGTEPLTGHDAVARALRVCGGGWHHLGRFLLIGVIAAVGSRLYPIVARNRHRLPGGIRVCEVSGQDHSA